MEFRDLKRQYQLHKEEMDMAISEVLTDTNFITGKQVNELEEALAQYVGVKHCISCANGTDALQLALMAWNIGVGDAVFVPDFTFFSSAEVITSVGATPIFVDIDADTFNISATSLEEAIQKTLQSQKLIPKVILAVDLFGQPADFPQITSIASKYNLLLLEDGAQGFGGSIHTQKACSFGDIATTSFFPAKPLGCYGDGGAIFTNDDVKAELLYSLRVHGKGTDKYDNVRIGMNSRLDTIQAAVLLQKMRFFEKEVQDCNDVAAEYTRLLADKVCTPLVLPQMRSSWAQYTILLKDRKQRDNVADKLKEAHIPSAVYYKKPMHLQQAFAGVECKVVDLSVTEAICETCLSLPMHAYLSKSEIEMICEVIKKAL